MKCQACKTEMQSLGQVPIRVGGTSGGWHLFFGEFADMSEGVWQLAPWQQPAPQEEASHTQAPFAHRCPAWQAGPPPQRQVPITAQVSALAVSQIAHAAAPVPQVLTERG